MLFAHLLFYVNACELSSLDEIILRSIHCRRLSSPFVSDALVITGSSFFCIFWGPAGSILVQPTTILSRIYRFSPASWRSIRCQLRCALLYYERGFIRMACVPFRKRTAGCVEREHTHAHTPRHTPTLAHEIHVASCFNRKPNTRAQNLL